MESISDQLLAKLSTIDQNLQKSGNNELTTQLIASKEAKVSELEMKIKMLEDKYNLLSSQYSAKYDQYKILLQQFQELSGKNA